jgi:hypothetical protein
MTAILGKPPKTIANLVNAYNIIDEKIKEFKTTNAVKTLGIAACKFRYLILE